MISQRWQILSSRPNQAGKALTAAIRVEGRLGGTKKPGAFEIQNMQLRETMALNDTMRSFLDAYRQVVSFSLFRDRFSPESILMLYPSTTWLHWSRRLLESM